MTEQLRAGQVGVKELIRLFRLAGFTVEDVTGDWRKQKTGVDLLFGFGTVEVKTDTHDTPNFFLEYECGGKTSGILTTQADWLFYYFPLSDTLYILPVVETAAWVRNNLGYLVGRFGKVVRSHDTRKKTQWSAKGLAVPRDFTFLNVPGIAIDVSDGTLLCIAGHDMWKILCARGMTNDESERPEGDEG